MTQTNRREFVGLAAAGILLPASASAQLPLIAPFVREDANSLDRRFGLGTGSDRRAILPLAAGRKRVWLDTSARSAGDGGSATTPFRDEAAAYAALNGGDQLMVAGGSVLTIPLAQLKSLSGINRSYPTVIQSYDPARPSHEGSFGLLTNRVTYLGDKPFLPRLTRAAAFVAVRGLRFDHSNDGALVEYHLGSGVDSLLIEQCGFLAAQLSLNNGSNAQTHVVRQSVFQGQWSSGGKAQGLYTSGVFDTVIEDCIFFHCGWKMGATRSTGAAKGGPTIFSHGVYAAVISGGVVRRCVFVDSASHGAQLRGNWHSHDNVFISCPIALLHGGGMNYAVEAPRGVMALAYRNVITIAAAITPSLPRGVGIDVANTRAGSVVEQNLIVGPGAGKTGRALSASAQTGKGYEPNPTLIAFLRNTNAWSTNNMGTASSRVRITAAANIVPTASVQFAAPTRDGLTAARALGFASIADLGYAMVANPSIAWANKIATHIQAGFRPKNLQLLPGVTFSGAVLPDGSWNMG